MGKVICLPLDYDSKVILRNYCDLLKSHYKEHYKLITNSCGNKLLSYHHLTTINHIEFSHPICQFISYLMKETTYSGLYCGIVSSSYLAKILEILQQIRMSFANVDIIIRLNKIKDVVLTYLDKMKKKEELTGDRLVCIVKSTLNVAVGTSFADRLAVSVVKALLLAIDESSNRLGHITIKAVDGRDNCEVYTGILYKEESLWVPKNENLGCGTYSVLLFTEPVQITSSSDHLKTSLDKFITSIIAANIKIVACQKSIRKNIIFLLRRHNILALERLGEESANALAYMSGAFPISDQSCINLEEIKTLAGNVCSLKKISNSNGDYLLIESKSKNVVTFFFSHRSFDTLDQLKTLIKENLHTVYSLCKSPYFLPENFDENLTGHLRNYEDSDLLVKQMMALFAESVEETYSATLRTDLLKSQRNDIYLLKRNSLANVFLTVANILEVGMYIAKN